MAPTHRSRRRDHSGLSAALDTWKGNQLEAYAAVGVRITATKTTDYGVIWFSARTEVDKVNRLVTLEDFKITKQNFPTLPENGSAYVQGLTNHAPWTQTIPLDELQASLATTSVASDQKTYPVKNDPPTIFYSTTPAVLALVDGDAKLGPAVNNLQRVINSRSLIYFDTANNMYYLAVMDAWVESYSLTGPWSEAQSYPQAQLDSLARIAVSKNLGEIMGDPSQSLSAAYEVSAMHQPYSSARRRPNCSSPLGPRNSPSYSAPAFSTSRTPAMTSSPMSPRRSTTS